MFQEMSLILDSIFGAKYIYVWMDVPVGYLASIKNWSKKNKIDFEELINKENVKLVHFIGKDIVYFHFCFGQLCLKPLM